MNIIKLALLTALIVPLNGFQATAQNFVIPLWPDGVPNQLKTQQEEEDVDGEIRRVSKVQNPQIEVFLPVKRNATGKAVLICPGGGYGVLAYDWEGTEIAKWLNSMGIAGVVLKYRLPSADFQPEPHKAPLQDAKKAMQLIRQHADQWQIEPEKVGVMGFSAGGHLASTLGTHIDPLPAEGYSSRPDFMVLVYPVISMSNDITHSGSKKNLIGSDPSDELVELYSNELQVSERTPPTFLVHSMDDKAVPVENSMRFYQALTKNNIPSEMHLYPHGGHGYSLALDKGHLEKWPSILAAWLKSY